MNRDNGILKLDSNPITGSNYYFQPFAKREPRNRRERRKTKRYESEN